MPRYTTSQTYTDGNTQIVALAEGGAPTSVGGGGGSLGPVGAVGGAIVEYKGGDGATKPQDDEDLEVKLRRISEQVPVRISNTSGSSAGSGSGDFHQYRQMRRREQDRLSRMEADYLKRTAEHEFLQRREERIIAAEERTAKKRAKRQKQKEKKKLKKSRLGPGATTEGDASAAAPNGGFKAQGNDSDDKSEESGDSDNDELVRGRERLGAPLTQLVAGGAA